MVTKVDKVTGQVREADAVPGQGSETPATIGIVVNSAGTATPADADLFPFSVSSVIKKITWAILKRFMRITRVQAVGNVATVTPNCDLYDCIDVTGIAQNFSVAAPEGTPTHLQKLQMQFKDNSTAWNITWNTDVYKAKGVLLPSITLAGKLTVLGFQYNSSTSTWDCIGGAQE